MQAAYDESHTNPHELQDLLSNCKSFGGVDDVYKSMGEAENKFGFRDLQRRCQKEFN
jgi:hypothetical protein